MCVTLINVASRNITFSLPEELLRKAKILAAQRDISLNALVRETLENTVSGRDRARRAGARLLRQTKSPLYDFVPGTWDRASLHE